MKLWLDDERPPPDLTWCWARTVHEVRLLLQRGTVEVLSLDNDLGSYSVKTGLEGRHALDDVIERAFCGTPPPKVVIHTQNPIARLSMVSAINAANRYGVGIQAEIRPARTPP